MDQTTFRHATKTILSFGAWIVVLLALTSAALATTEKILHTFDLNDGGEPDGGLIFDGQGNLYGTTFEGGNSGQGRGTVFELSPASDGSWTETVLYSFTGGQDGRNPIGRVIFDPQGNLYGTTEYGGVNDFGTVFKLTPGGSGGTWTGTVLHSFAGSTDGANPVGGLVFDSAGNLYGTTPQGGSSFGLGTVFKLKPVEGGQWKESIIHRFKGGDNGSTPEAGVIFDTSGNLYGTTAFGGSAGCEGNGCGTIFRLKPTDTGRWTGQVIHRFKGGIGGQVPLGGVIFDSAGNLYGTTEAGGGSGCEGGLGCGSVFELSPLSGGGWNAQLVHRFPSPGHGAHPHAGLTLDSAGNLYGTAEEGGGPACGGIGCGTVFELKPPGSSGGEWQETVLHVFNSKRGDGGAPGGAPALDASRNLYGTADGGALHFGIVFEIMP
jgi:uncharacterized repeat protein (TIGR03803 family)